MESEQIERKISWLDEQRRKDLDALERFDGKLKQLEESIAQQHEQIDSLSKDVARLSAVANRVSDFDDSLHRHRQEINRQLEAAEERRSEIWNNVEELRKADQEALAKRLEQLKAEVGRLEEFEEQLSTRRENDMRLTRTVDEIEKRLQDIEDRMHEQVRAMETVQDGRRSDSDRINQLQTELAGMHSKIESLQGVLDLAEDRGRRLETRIGELSATETERRESLETWMENQRRKLVDFERQWSEWEERFSSFEEQADELDESMVQYEETFRETRKLQKELNSVIDRLERRINEVTEMQRLTEDRMKQEWSSFKADDQKRWNTYKLTNEEQWREHNRQHKRLNEDLEQLQQTMTQTREKLDVVAEGVDGRIRGLLAMVRDWASELEQG